MRKCTEPATQQSGALLRRFYRARDGATAIEYALIAVGIGIAIVVGIEAVGGGVAGLFIDVGALFA